MKTTRYLLASLLVVLVSGAYAADHDAAAEPSSTAAKAHVLTRVELEQLLAKPDKVLVIDVRRPDEISTVGGLPVYLNIQIKELGERLAWIPHDRLIVTLSNHAGRAGKAAELLASHGFHVAGAAGAQTFEQQGGAIVHYAALRSSSGAAATTAH